MSNTAQTTSSSGITSAVNYFKIPQHSLQLSVSCQLEESLSYNTTEFY